MYLGQELRNLILIKSNPVITTLVYATLRLSRQMFCGDNSFLTAKLNIVPFRYNSIHL